MQADPNHCSIEAMGKICTMYHRKTTEGLYKRARDRRIDANYLLAFKI